MSELDISLSAYLRSKRSQVRILPGVPTSIFVSKTCRPSPSDGRPFDPLLGRIPFHLSSFLST
jgi:hypothetical protein